MSLTYIYLILAALAVVVGIIGMMRCFGHDVEESPWRYALAWGAIPVIMLFCGLAIAQSESNADETRKEWKSSCIEQGGEVVEIQSSLACLEPGYKFVNPSQSIY